MYTIHQDGSKFRVDYTFAHNGRTIRVKFFDTEAAAAKWVTQA